ncbi:MAG TPA: hypothetical protein PLZ38_06170 [Spirochaetota bacterium]|nr:hypothetical protein [Spirochaetota bacterium]
MRIVLFLLLLLLSLPLSAAPRVLVLKSYHDNITVHLDKYHIPYIVKRGWAVANDSLSGFDAVFIPCGVEQPPETSIQVMAHGQRIEGVSLKDDYAGIDYKRLNALLQDFVNNGGRLYAAGYSYQFVEAMGCSLSFFNNFPHFGTGGQIHSFLNDDFASFVMRNDIQLPVSYNGWVALESADAVILAKGYFPTVQGEREGPLAFYKQYGKGQVYYSAYHSELDSLYMRYFIFRVAYGALLDEMLYHAWYWGQKVVFSVVDTFTSDEYVRNYKCTLPRGTATIYLPSDCSLQVDIVAGKTIIGSWDSGQQKQITFYNATPREVIVSVYQAARIPYQPFSLVIAKGKRMVPYNPVVKVSAGALAIVMVIGFTWKRLNPRRFTGKRRYWFRDGHILNKQK